MSLMTLGKIEFSPCGCMGPRGSDKYCPCEMRNRGLESTHVWVAPTEAEKAKLIEAFKPQVAA